MLSICKNFFLLRLDAALREVVINERAKLLITQFSNVLAGTRLLFKERRNSLQGFVTIVNWFSKRKASLQLVFVLPLNSFPRLGSKY